MAQTKDRPTELVELGGKLSIT